MQLLDYSMPPCVLPKMDHIKSKWFQISPRSLFFNNCSSCSFKSWMKVDYDAGLRRIYFLCVAAATTWILMKTQRALSPIQSPRITFKHWFMPVRLPGCRREDVISLVSGWSVESERPCRRCHVSAWCARGTELEQIDAILNLSSHAHNFPKRRWFPSPIILIW